MLRNSLARDSLNLPLPDEISVAEVNGQVIHASPHNQQHVKELILHTTKSTWPPCRALPPKEELHPTSMYGEEILQETNKTWIDHVLKTLETFLTYDAEQAYAVLGCKLINTWRSVIGSPGYSARTKEANNTSKSLIAWHPYRQLLAVAVRDSCIYFYDVSRQEWTGEILQQVDQDQIYAMEWAPYAARKLAVGTGRGLLLWNYNAETNKYSSKLLRLPCGNAVDSLTWHPDGSLVAVGSKRGQSIYIWHTGTMQRASILHVSNVSITSLKWSPKGTYLFAATAGTTTMLWETATWTRQFWESSQGSCKTAAWSSNNMCLLTGYEGQPGLFPMLVTQSLVEWEVSDALSLSRHPLNTRKEKVYSADGNYSEYVGGPVRLLAWDPTGNRVALAFDAESAESNNLVAIYCVTWTPFLTFQLQGYLRGPLGSGSPKQLTFCNSFSAGALLAVLWSDEHVCFYPLVFQPNKN